MRKPKYRLARRPFGIRTPLIPFSDAQKMYVAAKRSEGADVRSLFDIFLNQASRKRWGDYYFDGWDPETAFGEWLKNTVGSAVRAIDNNYIEFFRNPVKAFFSNMQFIGDTLDQALGATVVKSAIIAAQENRSFSDVLHSAYIGDSFYGRDMNISSTRIRENLGIKTKTGIGGFVLDMLGEFFLDPSSWFIPLTAVGRNTAIMKTVSTKGTKFLDDALAVIRKVNPDMSSKATKALQKRIVQTYLTKNQNEFIDLLTNAYKTGLTKQEMIELFKVGTDTMRGTQMWRIFNTLAKVDDVTTIIALGGAPAFTAFKLGLSKLPKLLSTVSVKKLHSLDAEAKRIEKYLEKSFEENKVLHDLVVKYEHDLPGLETELTKYIKELETLDNNSKLLETQLKNLADNDVTKLALQDEIKEVHRLKISTFLAITHLEKAKNFIEMKSINGYSEFLVVIKKLKTFMYQAEEHARNNTFKMTYTPEDVERLISRINDLIEANPMLKERLYSSNYRVFIKEIKKYLDKYKITSGPFDPDYVYKQLTKDLDIDDAAKVIDIKPMQPITNKLKKLGKKPLDVIANLEKLNQKVLFDLLEDTEIVSKLRFTQELINVLNSISVKMHHRMFDNFDNIIQKLYNDYNVILYKSNVPNAYGLNARLLNEYLTDLKLNYDELIEEAKIYLQEAVRAEEIALKEFKAINTMTFSLKDEKMIQTFKEGLISEKYDIEYANSIYDEIDEQLEFETLGSYIMDHVFTMDHDIAAYYLTLKSLSKFFHPNSISAEQLAKSFDIGMQFRDFIFTHYKDIEIFKEAHRATFGSNIDEWKINAYRVNKMARNRARNRVIRAKGKGVLHPEQNVYPKYNLRWLQQNAPVVYEMVRPNRIRVWERIIKRNNTRLIVLQNQLVENIKKLKSKHELEINELVKHQSILLDMYKNIQHYQLIDRPEYLNWNNAVTEVEKLEKHFRRQQDIDLKMYQIQQNIEALKNRTSDIDPEHIQKLKSERQALIDKRIKLEDELQEVRNVLKEYDETTDSIKLRELQDKEVELNEQIQDKINKQKAILARKPDINAKHKEWIEFSRYKSEEARLLKERMDVENKIQEYLKVFKSDSPLLRERKIQLLELQFSLEDKLEELRIEKESLEIHNIIYAEEIKKQRKIRHELAVAHRNKLQKEMKDLRNNYRKIISWSKTRKIRGEINRLLELNKMLQNKINSESPISEFHITNLFPGIRKMNLQKRMELAGYAIEAVLQDHIFIREFTLLNSFTSAIYKYHHRNLFETLSPEDDARFRQLFLNLYDTFTAAERAYYTGFYEPGGQRVLHKDVMNNLYADLYDIYEDGVILRVKQTQAAINYVDRLHRPENEFLYASQQEKIISLIKQITAANPGNTDAQNFMLIRNFKHYFQSLNIEAFYERYLTFSAPDKYNFDKTMEQLFKFYYQPESFTRYYEVLMALTISNPELRDILADVKDLFDFILMNSGADRGFVHIRRLHNNVWKDAISVQYRFSMEVKRQVDLINSKLDQLIKQYDETLTEMAATPLIKPDNRFKKLMDKFIEKFPGYNSYTDMYPIVKNLTEDHAKLNLFESHEYVIFDVETTGADPLNDQIWQIGAHVMQDGRILKSKVIFIDLETGTKFTEEAKQKTGMDENQLLELKAQGKTRSLREALDEFTEFVTDGYTLNRFMIGHNVTFDYRFLMTTLKKLNIEPDGLFGPFIDTYQFALRLLMTDPNIKSYTNEDLARYFGIDEIIKQKYPENKWHDAGFDSEITGMLWFKLLDLIKSNEAYTKYKKVFNTFGDLNSASRISILDEVLSKAKTVDVDDLSKYYEDTLTEINEFINTESDILKSTIIEYSDVMGFTDQLITMLNQTDITMLQQTYSSLIDLINELPQNLDDFTKEASNLTKQINDIIKKLEKQSVGKPETTSLLRLTKQKINYTTKIVNTIYNKIELTDKWFRDLEARYTQIKGKVELKDIIQLFKDSVHSISRIENQGYLPERVEIEIYNLLMNPPASDDLIEWITYLTELDNQLDDLFLRYSNKEVSIDFEYLMLNQLDFTEYVLNPNTEEYLKSIYTIVSKNKQGVHASGLEIIQMMTKDLLADLRRIANDYKDASMNLIKLVSGKDIPIGFRQINRNFAQLNILNELYHSEELFKFSEVLKGTVNEDMLPDHLQRFSGLEQLLSKWFKENQDHPHIIHAVEIMDRLYDNIQFIGALVEVILNVGDTDERYISELFDIINHIDYVSKYNNYKTEEEMITDISRIFSIYIDRNQKRIETKENRLANNLDYVEPMQSLPEILSLIERKMRENFRRNQERMKKIIAGEDILSFNSNSLLFNPSALMTNALYEDLKYINDLLYAVYEGSSSLKKREINDAIKFYEGVNYVNTYAEDKLIRVSIYTEVRNYLYNILNVIRQPLMDIKQINTKYALDPIPLNTIRAINNMTEFDYIAENSISVIKTSDAYRQSQRIKNKMYRTFAHLFTDNANKKSIFWNPLGITEYDIKTKAPIKKGAWEEYKNIGPALFAENTKLYAIFEIFANHLGVKPEILADFTEQFAKNTFKKLDNIDTWNTIYGIDTPLEQQVRQALTNINYLPKENIDEFIDILKAGYIETQKIMFPKTEYPRINKTSIMDLDLNQHMLYNWNQVRGLFGTDEDFLRFLKTSKNARVIVVERVGGLNKLKSVRINTLEDLKMFESNEYLITGIVTEDVYKQLRKKYAPVELPKNIQRLRKWLLHYPKVAMLFNFGFAVSNILEGIFKTALSGIGFINKWKSLAQAHGMYDLWHKYYLEASQDPGLFATYRYASRYHWINYFFEKQSDGSYLTKNGIKISSEEFEIISKTDEFFQSAAGASEMMEFTKTLYIHKDKIGKRKLRKDSSLDQLEAIMDRIAYTGIVAKNFSLNARIEGVSRLGLYLNSLESGLSKNESLYKVLNTFFNYGDKSAAELYAEFIIPFISYPIRNYLYFMDILSQGNNARIMADALMIAFDNEEVKNNDYLLYRMMRGDIPIAANYLFGTGFGGLDAFVDLPSLGETTKRKMHPLLRLGLSGYEAIQQGSAEIFNKQLQYTPLVGQSINIINTVADLFNEDKPFGNTDIVSMFPSVITRYYAYQNYQFNRKPHNIYNELYTKNGYSRLRLQTMPTTKYNIKYKIQNIMWQFKRRV